MVGGPEPSGEIGSGVGACARPRHESSMGAMMATHGGQGFCPTPTDPRPARVTEAPRPPGRRVNYELRAVEGSRLVLLFAFRLMEQVMKAAPKADDRLLSIWAVPESGGAARLVAVRNEGDKHWTVIETSHE